MKQSLILLAGYPGTGKSYLMNQIVAKFLEIQILSPDELKEKNWDLVGFDTFEEKEVLIQKSWDEYYQIMEEKFQKGYSLISDYPFSEKQRSKLEMISDKYQIQVITIRLIADLDVLFERQKLRDLDTTRHLGHILKSYHKNGATITHQQADNLLSYEEFISRCTTRGYGEFSLGKLIEVDVSDFSKVDYEELLLEIQNLF